MTKYCVKHNDNVAWCVCKHCPCDVLKEIKKEIEYCEYGDCKTCKYSNADDCRSTIFKNVIKMIKEFLNDRD